jgi:hypothetical protein
MFPTLLSGEVVRAVESDGNSLLPGQVLVMRGDDGPFVHRFVRYVRPRGLDPLMITAGDCSGPDLPCPVPERVLVACEVLRRGRWRPIRRAGKPVVGALPGRLHGMAARLLAKALR